MCVREFGFPDRKESEQNEYVMRCALIPSPSCTRNYSTRERKDPRSGRAYYWNVATRQVSWELPQDAVLEVIYDVDVCLGLLVWLDL